ncbi:MAG: peptidoglycan hydrolase-like protein with peptidoglycan-binding domain [Arenicella sp.]|jgi:peptidoglycan hydrolase-like protein with peptidoglycan-binding domain
MTIILRRGSGSRSSSVSERNSVIEFQTDINKIGAMLKADGYFGRATEEAVKFTQKLRGVPETGDVGSKFLKWAKTLKNPYPLLNINGIAHIAKAETGGLSYYERTAKVPHFLGESSGIAIGVGYDIGQNSAAELKSVWKAYLSHSLPLPPYGMRYNSTSELPELQNLWERWRVSMKHCPRINNYSVHLSKDITKRVF